MASSFCKFWSFLSVRRYSKIGMREWPSTIDSTSWESWDIPTMGRMSSKRRSRYEKDLLLLGLVNEASVSCCGSSREVVEKKVFNEEPSHACLAK